MHGSACRFSRPRRQPGLGEPLFSITIRSKGPNPNRKSARVGKVEMEETFVKVQGLQMNLGMFRRSCNKVEVSLGGGSGDDIQRGGLKASKLEPDILAKARFLERSKSNLIQI